MPKQRILRDDVQFAAAALDERTRLAQDGLGRPRAIPAANEGDRAVGAAVGAPLGDLQVGERLPSEAQRGDGRLDPFLRDARPVVHPRKAGLGLRVALRVATRDDDFLVEAALLQFEGAADLGLGLLTRRGDERARVDDDRVGAFALGDETRTALDEATRQHLQIDRVLGAAERDERDGVVGEVFHGDFTPMSESFMEMTREMPFSCCETP